MLLAPLSIDGSEPQLFVVDTGAPTTVVTQQIATQLQLVGDRPARGVGASGTTTASYAAVRRIAMGDEAVDGMRIGVVSDFHNLKAGMSGAQGVLGLDFLSQFCVRIDYPRAQLSLHSRGIVGADRGVPFEHTRLIFVSAQAEGRIASFALDTGASVTIVAPSLVPDHTLREGRALRGVGGGGSVSGVRTTTLSTLQVGPYVRNGLEVNVADFFAPLIAISGHDMQGLIGANFFEHNVITFDFGTQRFTVE